MLHRILLAAVVFALSAAPVVAKPRVLIFSKTTGYRHDSIPAGVAALKAIAGRIGADATASEDPEMFASGRLRDFEAIVLLSATTDPKNPASEWLVGERRAALQAFVRSGGGVVAVHAAADSHYHWPWYGRMIGARFQRHPEGTPKGMVSVIDQRHPGTAGLAHDIERVDEWYYVDDYDPTAALLVTLDPASIGEKDVNPNPMSWARSFEGGRVFTTVMGHTAESYSEPWFLRHLENGLGWTLQR